MFICILVYEFESLSKKIMEKEHSEFKNPKNTNNVIRKT